MTNLRKYVGFFVALLGASVLFMGIANAQDFRSGTNVVVEQAEVIDSTIYVAGRTVTINAEVFGDVFCAGQTVTISGTVHGDVICGGQTITISGSVDGDVRLAGQTVTLNASVAGNATVAGQTFVQASTAEISGDLTAGSSDVTLNGRIGRDLAVGGDSVVISSEVGRNIKGDVEQLELLAGASVGGDIAYTSQNDVIRDSGATVLGSITRSASQESSPKRGAVFGFGLAWFAFLFISMMVVALAIALIFPAVLHEVTNRAMPRPWKALLIGLVASIVMPVVIVLVAITIIGLPLAMLIGFIWLVISTLSGPFTGYYLGRLLLKDSRHTLKIMLVGASALLVLYFIPFIGFFALLGAYWIGSGMLLMELTRRTPKPAYEINTKSRKKK